MAIKNKKKPNNNKRSSSSSEPNAAFLLFSPMASPPPFGFRKLSVMIPVLIVVCLLAVFTISSNFTEKMFASASLFSIEVVNEFPHDPNAFTQGLLYAGNDTLYESTGLYGRSSVRKVELRTGKFKKFTHQMKDGWGLATDGKVLFGSDGTSVLYRIDPVTLKVIVNHVVKYNDREVRYLNELEYVNGEVWANVWQTDCIARISPHNGIVLGWILLPDLRKGLLERGHRGIDVLNGIALDKDNHRIFVTGKLWPKLYEIKLHPIEKQLDNGFIERFCIP